MCIGISILCPFLKGRYSFIRRPFFPPCQPKTIVCKRISGVNINGLVVIGDSPVKVFLFSPGCTTSGVCLYIPWGYLNGPGEINDSLVVVSVFMPLQTFVVECRRIFSIDNTTVYLVFPRISQADDQENQRANNSKIHSVLLLLHLPLILWRSSNPALNG
ncbi:hypothetical protein MBAV_004307 [Candidatus Magnetobacterium bavaricum]|uniref:Uncharacterized protein n=1 Tax=Candidatus Magnetobacterium bavaricum TaxID=29290 RepID=A0A0F3GS32_9BACT|nr:hypothetical protein MBAV_004307 [Candidatus Magnetobacterium bavaricum]